MYLKLLVRSFTFEKVIKCNQELTALGSPDPTPESQHDKWKVGTLKDKIRCTGLPIKNYQTPRELADFVFEDLQSVCFPLCTNVLESIDADFPKESKPSYLEIENYGHSTFADSKCMLYIPKPDLFQKLDIYVKGDDRYPVQ